MIFLLLICNLSLSYSCVTSAYIKEWNDLKITWGRANDTNAFLSMPRTEQEAVSRGWIRYAGCAEGFKGNRFTLNNDRNAILIFDANGLIAGTASSFRKGLPFNFPSERIQNFFDDEGSVWTISIYFTDPNKACQRDVFSRWMWGGTGDRLVLSSKKTTLNIPLKENELSSKWTQGQCFRTMGQHYWMDMDGTLGLNTNKDNFFPIFLLYNRGSLNGLGWAFNADLPSPKFEHPTAPILNFFFKSIPKFFADPSQSGTLSTLHIFLDSTPLLNAC